MKVLILGGSGMLGHKLWQVFAPIFDTWVTFHSSVHAYARYGLFDSARAINGVSATDFDSVVRAMAMVHPDVVINAIGIVKQLNEAKDPLVSVAVNSLFPHRLAELCHASGVRLIHISTDCVFSGHKGSYSEADLPDPVDLYGRSKLLGEVDRPGCLTLRTSIIGWELERRTGLLEWFAACRGQKVRGYVNAIYTGLSTRSLSLLIAHLIIDHPGLSGLYHVSSTPISKYDLLVGLRQALGWPVEIEPYTDLYCNRSLDSTRFQDATGWHPPSWDEMIGELATEWPVYAHWRGEK